MTSALGSAPRELGNPRPVSQPLWSLVPSFINANDGASSTELMPMTALGKLQKAPRCDEGLLGCIFRGLSLSSRLPPLQRINRKMKSPSPPPEM